MSEQLTDGTEGYTRIVLSSQRPIDNELALVLWFSSLSVASILRLTARLKQILSPFKHISYAIGILPLKV